MYINLFDSANYTLSKNLNTQKSFSFGNIKKKRGYNKKKIMVTSNYNFIDNFSFYWLF